LHQQQQNALDVAMWRRRRTSTAHDAACSEGHQLQGTDDHKPHRPLCRV
jgi:hypothetical protein